MSRTTQVTYVCDGCDSEVARRDLYVFQLRSRKVGGQSAGAAETELCQRCEEKLIKAIEPLFALAEDLRRDA